MIMLISMLFLMTLVGCNNIDKKETREVSSTFSLPITLGDGTEGEYLLIGEEGKVGFLVGIGKKGEVVEEKIIANKVNKYMWYFWGDKDSISGNFKVVGTDKEGKEHPVLVSVDDTVWQYSNTFSHIPSNMMFPTSGLWKLEIYFNEKLFGEIVINVEDS
ncbi:DUF4871 domain-containing protein [Lysinibacillus sp. FJAT-14745]|uniref:DUF4871 domain-containing protein n=1 Tax=Lysinibacillus sp. FJAT-14745 TaxID=1704289 RepID=UPI000B1961FE|nr:DUF4871 domain-containing protein [Lysinibacillus sp. FJAT-14745]